MYKFVLSLAAGLLISSSASALTCLPNYSGSTGCDTNNPAGDCETLGYELNPNCDEGHALACPFDTRYKKCVGGSGLEGEIECVGYNPTGDPLKLVSELACRENYFPVANGMKVGDQFCGYCAASSCRIASKYDSVSEYLSNSDTVSLWEETEMNLATPDGKMEKKVCISSCEWTNSSDSNEGKLKKISTTNCKEGDILVNAGRASGLAASYNQPGEFFCTSSTAMPNNSRCTTYEQVGVVVRVANGHVWVVNNSGWNRFSCSVPSGPLADLWEVPTRTLLREINQDINLTTYHYLFTAIGQPDMCRFPDQTCLAWTSDMGASDIRSNGTYNVENASALCLQVLDATKIGSQTSTTPTPTDPATVSQTKATRLLELASQTYKVCRQSAAGSGLCRASTGICTSSRAKGQGWDACVTDAYGTPPLGSSSGTDKDKCESTIHRLYTSVESHNSNYPEKSISLPSLEKLLEQCDTCVVDGNILPCLE